MAITTVDYALPYHTHNKYDVSFHSEIIHTMVTDAPSMVTEWLSNLSCNRHNGRFLVGLDVEWLPNRQRFVDNPIAVLQLCVDRECLVFQILHASFVPQSLVSFLENKDNTFVGVGIQDDVVKLLRDHSLVVTNFVELRTLAAQRFSGPEVRSFGLKTLALRVLDKDIEKPKKITMSKWDNLRLTAQQVQYACIDAFASFEIGRILYSSRV
ncbi:3'-5' exonuclease-like [Cicer arietinum]|uniref:Werner Syndrome-like exonuclease n=1 Tax=Cicer arietinum TaxID=3827 RepID=A0A1S2Z3P3_CICAR|nr:Werner Syndrome-like exonuclease [Cicer arietinum]